MKCDRRRQKHIEARDGWALVISHPVVNQRARGADGPKELGENEAPPFFEQFLAKIRADEAENEPFEV